MQSHKLSAAMLTLVQKYKSRGALGIAAESRFITLSREPAPGKAPSVHVFLRCDQDKKITSARVGGIAVHRELGRVRTAVVRLDMVGELSEDPAVERISPARALRPLLDVASAKTHVTAFKANKDRHGAGVIVGIVDSGIDASHPAFQGRILSIWDQTNGTTGWGTTNYGQVFNGAALAQAGTDENGHGTHVAGIAAGADATYQGIADQADLIVVKTNFQNTGIADGVRYVFSEAQRLNRPCVVNLSLGGHWDAHDGSDDLAAAIDQETGQGRLVVAAAGNEGEDAIHGAANIAPGATAELAFQITPSTANGAAPWVVLNGWYPGSAQCEVSVRASTGVVTPPQGELPADTAAKVYNVTGARIQVTTPPAAVNPNGDHQFLVEIGPGPFSNTVQGGAWTLVVKNTGSAPCRVDVWSIVPEGALPAAFQGAAAENTMKIGSPGTASSAITVAAYTTRNKWTDSTGAENTVGLAPDTICGFSSPGPLRRGAAKKPDLTAPGAMLVSALSAQSSPNPRYIVVPGWRVDAGTSMASPFVAGIVALLLEAQQQLTPANAKSVLQGVCAVPGQPAGSWDSDWGYGYIDATNLP